ncbi:MAG: hypothetical protein WCP36_00180 [Methanomicrobiales archaeon]
MESEELNALIKDIDPRVLKGRGKEKRAETGTVPDKNEHGKNASRSDSERAGKNVILELSLLLTKT